MKTIDKVITELQEKKPHVYSDETVADWCSTVDGDVSLSIRGLTDAAPYEWPGDRDKELLVPSPYDDIYFLFCAAQIDFLNREYGHYANAYAMFNERYNEYAAHYIRNNRPASAGFITV